MEGVIQKGPHVINVYLPTYITEPNEEETFYPSQVRKIAREVVVEVLKGNEYVEAKVDEWSLTIANSLRERVKALKVPRYKLIVEVAIGQKKDQGVRIASRCLWDTSTDNYGSFSYQNQSLWCNIMCFGLYID